MKNVHVHTLTLSDVVEGPLVVLEEGVALDVIHSGAAETNRPAQSERDQDCERSGARPKHKTHPGDCGKAAGGQQEEKLLSV